MPDLGSIGTVIDGYCVRKTYPAFGKIVIPVFHSMSLFAAKSATGGYGSAPCLYMPCYGGLKFRWAMFSGTRTISVMVYQPANVSPRPSMKIYANPAVGILSDIETSAASSTAWTRIGPVTVAATADGALWVELKNNYPGLKEDCYWDSIATT